MSDKFARERFLCGSNICKVGEHICDESTSTCYEQQDMVVKGLIPANVPRINVDPETGEVYRPYLYSSHSLYGQYSTPPSNGTSNTASTYPFDENTNFQNSATSDQKEFTFCIPQSGELSKLAQIESMINHEKDKTISIVTTCGDLFVQRICNDPFDNTFTVNVLKNQVQHFDNLVEGRLNFRCAAAPT